jgi:hypothetical protein
VDRNGIRLDSRAWSPAIVGAHLVRAFRTLPDRSIYAAGDVLIAADGRELRELDLVRASARYLGRASPERVAVLTWARCAALRLSVRELCSERGWSRGTFMRRRARALAAIANGLNRDDVPLK